jgi:hypothetical protein
VFTAQYALSPYIKQIRFVFKASLQSVFKRSIGSVDISLSRGFRIVRVQTLAMTSLRRILSAGEIGEMVLPLLFAAAAVAVFAGCGFPFTYLSFSCVCVCHCVYRAEVVHESAYFLRICPSFRPPEISLLPLDEFS